MNKEGFVKAAVHCVNLYIDNIDRFGTDPQLKVNPVSLNVSLVDDALRNQSLAYSQEAIEAAAGVEGDASESATDFQAAENPDFYPVKSLLKTGSDGITTVDVDAIRKIADSYSAVNDTLPL